jgi:hypothetical protein
MLILASDGGIYNELQTLWASYMNTLPESIEAYFYKGDPTLQTDYEIRGNTLYVKCPEQLWSLVKKFQMALKAFEDRFAEFDYICRPNLSSFWIFDRYLKALENLPREKHCYAVCNTHPIYFPSGCGFTITPDIATEYINKAPPIACIGGDDVALGALLADLRIPISGAPRIDINYERDWPKLDKLDKEPSIFHVRIKHEHNRIINDIHIQKMLIKKIYFNQVNDKIQD